MILGVAILDVIPGRGGEFQRAFAKAQNIIASMPGYVSHDLKRCIENASRYLLLVNWNTLEDHTEGFRRSDSVTSDSGASRSPFAFFGATGFISC